VATRRVLARCHPAVSGCFAELPVSLPGPLAFICKSGHYKSVYIFEQYLKILTNVTKFILYYTVAITRLYNGNHMIAS
jgi:hypothetical protein